MGRRGKISKEQVFQVLRDRDRDGEPILTTVEVADRLNVTTPTARKRLNTLVEDGRVRRRDIGQAVVFWPSDERLSQEPTPISGRLAEEVDEYTEEQGEPRSAAIRRLVELGLEAEEAQVKPGEMKAQLAALEDELNRQEEAKNRWQEYALAGGFVSAGVALAMVGVAFPTTQLAGLPFASQAANAVQFVGALAITVGLFGWFGLILRSTLPQRPLARLRE